MLHINVLHCTLTLQCVTLLCVIHFTILTALCYNEQCTFVYFTVLDARIFMLCSIDVVQIQILNIIKGKDKAQISDEKG